MRSPSRGLAAAGLTLLSCTGTSTPAGAPLPLDREAAVYAAALDSLFYRWTDDRRPVLVLDSTVPSKRPGGFPLLRGLDSSTVADFAARNRDAGFIGQHRELLKSLRPVPIEVVPKDTLEGLPETPDAYWRGFQARFPNSIGWATLSGIGFSRDGRQALLDVSYSCGTMCGWDRVVFLRQTGSRWRVTWMFPAWVP